MSQVKSPMNVQDGFYNQLRKENTLIHIYLINGKRLTGKVRRFDRYAVVLGVRQKEILIYKHAIASVTLGEPDSGEPQNYSSMD
ncbi:MAG TPA: RNA chaperone Hfq [Thermoanaerobaculia bacterium]|nr:RNA chaperone Hfq [Thermoanaerobaculia bacterium]HUM30787.1 RNA chaperone Hfq [Thermoanaerobaculia bacterium]HXK69013.1 RNA chaperone Hfq [Thermoanaerobaculia bacterium]